MDRDLRVAIDEGGGPGFAVPPGLVGYRVRPGPDELLVLEWPTATVEPARPLSPTESEVLALALAGLPAARIAARRRRSRKTVENQLASAFAKLGVRSRLELFARFALGTTGTAS